MRKMMRMTWKTYYENTPCTIIYPTFDPSLLRSPMAALVVALPRTAESSALCAALAVQLDVPCFDDAAALLRPRPRPVSTFILNHGPIPGHLLPVHVRAYIDAHCTDCLVVRLPRPDDEFSAADTPAPTPTTLDSYGLMEVGDDAVERVLARSMEVMMENRRSRM
jgi:hypothetical protein